MPDKEQKIVFVRMREFEGSMTVPSPPSRPWPSRPDAHRDHDRSQPPGPWGETLDFVLEAEKLGLDICWVAEAWGSDAPSPLGYLAARTDRLLLGSGIIQLGTRTPPLIAMTAMTLAQLSGGRFLLGLGPSGPQVIEGLHGVPFARPLAGCGRPSR